MLTCGSSFWKIAVDRFTIPAVGTSSKLMSSHVYPWRWTLKNLLWLCKNYSINGNAVGNDFSRKIHDIKVIFQPVILFLKYCFNIITCKFPSAIAVPMKIQFGLLLLLRWISACIRLRSHAILCPSVEKSSFLFRLLSLPPELAIYKHRLLIF